MVFTGIIEEIGTIKDMRKSSGGMILRILAEKVCEELSVGDSLSVQGACLTVVEVSEREVAADVSLETLDRTNLGLLKPGSRVNLERALRVGGRLGGHIVLGHVDGVGVWERLLEEGNGWRAFISLPEEINEYIVEKGSVAVDGVSLTVASCEGRVMTVALIPHTMSVTTLGDRKPGDRVNLEADIVGKYIYRYLRSGKESGGSDGAGLMEKLREGGFI